MELVMVANIAIPRASNISPEEWTARVDLAALHHLYVHFGWTDLIYTHLTHRVPGEPEHYLIKADHLMMDEVTASNLIKVDMEGNTVAGDHAPNQAGHLIHTAILKARPDINVAAHTHSRAGAAVSCTMPGLLPLSQHANMIIPTIAYHDYQDVTQAEDECAALAHDIGDKFLMIMRNHGLLALGRSVAECFYFLYYLEMACKIQIDVLASGQEPVLVSNETVETLYLSGGQPGDVPLGVRVWPSMLRMLERKDASFRE